VAASVAAPTAALPGRIYAVVRGLRPVWSVPAALRAVRAAIVIAGLFAVCVEVIGNRQMATFAAFGGFATLVLAGFGGGRRDQLMAHVGLAVIGGVLVVIGTAVNSLTAVAAVVTLVVAFCVLFAGVISANVASGGTAALLAYVLPAASPGTVGMIPSRLEGWLLASAAGTMAVLVLQARIPTDRLRSTTSKCASAVADQLDAALAGEGSTERAEAATAAKHDLLSAFTEVPYRPTGLTVSDQAIASLVEDLQWCTTSVAEATTGEAGCFRAREADRQRFEQASVSLRLTAELIDGGRADGLEEAVRALGDLLPPVSDLGPDSSPPHDDVHRTFHSRLVAGAVRMAALDALVAARRIAPSEAAEEVERWWGGSAGVGRASGKYPLFGAVEGVVGRHANLRSIWFLNSVRGAVALAAAVAVADVTNVQHGFWVVLGALSVLRTNAAATGAIALRAIAGTVAGFVVGAVLIVAIGHHSTALWVALPLAVLIAAYAPGTAPFAVGQAAFTVTISVLYNIIVPVGWKVGEVRIEDVALGVGVSVVVGALFWPRGATGVVARDLAEAFRTGGLYLVQATAWALGLLDEPPDAGPSVVTAGARLDEALRGLLSEQGSKRVAKEHLWHLAGGAMRLRFMAHALARTQAPVRRADRHQARTMMGEAVRVAGLYDGLATGLGGAPVTVAEELARLPLGYPAGLVDDGQVVWVGQHVDHLRRNLDDLRTPAEEVANRISDPWWR
jgi:uncharacterized membrane protein YccC